MLRVHLASVANVRAMAAEEARDSRGRVVVSSVVDHSSERGRKPGTLRPRVAVGSLTPISVAELCAGTTHTGRILRGTLVAPPFVMSGAMTVLEDAHGRLMKLAVYNTVPAHGLTMAQRNAAAEALLPVGASVAIVEPFFKVFMDGTCGVRVDDPRDLVQLEASPAAARDAAAWRVEGNACFRGGQHAEAARCYTAALRALDADGASARLLSGTLCNLAAALLAQPGSGREEAARALLAACAARAVDPESTSKRRFAPRVRWRRWAMRALRAGASRRRAVAAPALRRAMSCWRGCPRAVLTATVRLQSSRSTLPFRKQMRLRWGCCRRALLMCSMLAAQLRSRHAATSGLLPATSARRRMTTWHRCAACSPWLLRCCATAPPAACSWS